MPAKNTRTTVQYGDAENVGVEIENAGVEFAELNGYRKPLQNL